MSDPWSQAPRSLLAPLCRRERQQPVNPLRTHEFTGVSAADPQSDQMERGEATEVFIVQPVDWVDDWNENPALHWIIVQFGRWLINSLDDTASTIRRTSSRSARTRAAGNMMAAKVIAPKRSVTFRAA